MLAMKECIRGVADFYCATPPFMADEIDVWYDVYVRLEDDSVTVYSGTPGGHTTKGTKLAKKSRPMRGDAGALNLECGESGAARRFGGVWS
jgi:hypothetical protein